MSAKSEKTLAYHRRSRELAKANGGVYPGSIKHGVNGYSNYGCRCDECCRGWSSHLVRARVDRYARSALNDGIAPTGTHNRYTYANWGCRCDVCCSDRAAAGREKRARRRTRLLTSAGGAS